MPVSLPLPFLHHRPISFTIKILKTIGLITRGHVHNSVYLWKLCLKHKRILLLESVGGGLGEGASLDLPSGRSEQIGKSALHSAQLLPCSKLQNCLVLQYLSLFAVAHLSKSLIQATTLPFSRKWPVTKLDTGASPQPGYQKLCKASLENCKTNKLIFQSCNHRKFPLHLCKQWSKKKRDSFIIFFCSECSSLKP